MNKDAFRELVDKDYADNFMTGRIYELTQEEIDKLSQTKEVNMSEQTTIKKTVEELINSQDCPLPLNVIPNSMGINLCSVDSIEWTKQADGQLLNLKINFLPLQHPSNFITDEEVDILLQTINTEIGK